VRRDLGIELYSDCGTVEEMVAARRADLVRGFTTNPTLMREAGVADYPEFAKAVLDAIPDRPVSFHVLADSFVEMEREARVIAGWGDNVFVKIPITNTRGESSCPLIDRLTSSGVRVNVTALLSVDQVRAVVRSLSADTPALVSVLAGRIADTGRDPEPVIRESKSLLVGLPNAKLLWASSWELLNVFQAARFGCDVIAVAPAILAKLPLIDTPLEELSLDTVKRYQDDATAAGYHV
jgi:transaldolase